MAYTETNNVIINNLTFAQYKALRAINALNANQAYCITDIDLVIDACVPAWAIRTGKVIPAGNFLFLNQSTVDMSALPTNTTLLTLKGSSGLTVNLSIVEESGQYVCKAIPVGASWTQTISTGASLSTMQAAIEYLSITSTGYGDFVTIEYVHSALLNIVDNLIKFNQKF